MNPHAHRRTRAIVAVATLLLSLFAGLAHAALDEAAFTERFVQALEKALPDREVTVVAPLHLEVASTDPDESAAVSAYLDNAYATYLQEPEALDEIIDTWVGGLAGSFTATTSAIDAADIVPIVKDSAWPAAMTAALLRQGAETPPDYHQEALADGLIVLYAEDRPTSIRYLGPDDLASLDVELVSLRERALGNLGRRLPDLRILGEDGLFMLDVGGNFEASLLLLDSLWSDENFGVEGELVMAVPARDAVLVSGTKEQLALPQLRELAREIHAQSPYALTPALYVRRKGAWVLLDP